MSDTTKDEITTLGKRKRNADLDKSSSFHGSTIFVSNLPYSCTSTDLETLFSDIAPVRSAFVVLENGVSKGVGYVSFAIKEDAARAMDVCQEKGLDINGRRLRVQWADAKPREKDKVVKKKDGVKPQPTPRPSVTKVEKDPNAIRTIVISGLPSSIDSKILWKKVRKYEGAEKLESYDEAGDNAYVLFTTPSAASRAVEKLHAHIFKGSLLSVTLKKRIESVAKISAKSADGQTNVTKVIPNRASRLIVRNLPWNITEHDLRALFLPFGPIHSIHIPRAKSSEEGGRSHARGFAFVWYVSKKDAERGMDGVNGRTVRAGAISAPTMNKKERARLRRRLRANTEGRKDDCEEEKVDDDDKDDEEHSGERIVAVDWALSKDKWEEVKAQGGLEMPENEEDGGDDDEDASNDEDDDGVIGGENGNDDYDSGENEDEDDDTDEDDGSGDVDEDGMSVDRSDDEKPVKPTLPQTDVGTTLFIRNIPYEATEDELRTLFGAFGSLRYARITLDPETERSRGTGFACFWRKEHADQAIEQSELLRKETVGDVPQKNPFSMPSILTPDPSSSLAKSLVLHGRTLDVVRAVTRDEAGRLKDEGERRREKADKRNMYLLREGAIFVGMPAASSLSAKELEARANSFNARRTLLRTNPSLYVSRTRLSIRSLPLFTSEYALKKLAMHALQEFEKDVEEGKRESLTADESRKEADRINDEVEKEQSRTNSKSKRSKSGKDSRIRQAKIVRQADRVDAVTGKSRSRGYGFLELYEHADALRVLRWANNNSNVGRLLESWWSEELKDIIKKAESPQAKKLEDTEDPGAAQARMKRLKNELQSLEEGSGRKSKRQLIVEFSIENSQVVNRRKELQSQQKDPSKGTRRVSTLGVRAIEHEEAERDDEEENFQQQRRGKRARTSKDFNVVPILPEHEPKVDENDGEKKNKVIRTLIGRKRKERKARSKA